MPTRPIQPDHHLLEIQLESLHAASWYPTRQPVGKPQQVHLFINVAIPGGPADPDPLKLQFVTRFKTAQALDRFIEQLLMSREDVWGPWQRDTTLREDIEIER